MITINLENIGHREIELFARDYAVSYYAGFEIFPIMFLGTAKLKKEHFFKIFKLTVKKLAMN